MAKTDETVIRDAETITKLFDAQLESMDKDIERHESILLKLRTARAEFAASRAKYAEARDINGG